MAPSKPSAATPSTSQDGGLSPLQQKLYKLSADIQYCLECEYPPGVEKNEDILIKIKELSAVASVSYRPQYEDTGRDVIVVCHKGTHTAGEWLLNFSPTYYPPWEETKEMQAEAAAEAAALAAIKGIQSVKPGTTKRIFDEPWGFVHLGFLAYSLATRAQVRKAVKDIIERDSCKQPLILLTGNSLGSSAATAGLLDFHEEVRKILEKAGKKGVMHAVLAAGPRAGTKRYVDAIVNLTELPPDHTLPLAEYTRYVYQADLVAQVPPDWSAGGFTHVPQKWLHFYEDYSAVWEKPESGPSLPGYLWSWVKRRVWLKDAVADHDYKGRYYDRMVRFATTNSLQPGAPAKEAVRPTCSRREPNDEFNT